MDKQWTAEVDRDVWLPRLPRWLVDSRSKPEPSILSVAPLKNNPCLVDCRFRVETASQHSPETSMGGDNRSPVEGLACRPGGSSPSGRSTIPVSLLSAGSRSTTACVQRRPGGGTDCTLTSPCAGHVCMRPAWATCMQDRPRSSPTYATADMPPTPEVRPAILVQAHLTAAALH
ncbi:hypothetical protein Micbo1qcDRAFT_163707 [Microdochium bolleyi]|uniref:Uncharacterized protein n=1 Tax=Microdochium bolleyi TaxID=196109 RepID=A0A136J1C3_9PEZI|nr:hypothetical protein Micbo1qcDRAFT_163707 [Microdochium bolleyi]